MNQEQLKYSIILSNRRTVSIVVNGDGSVLVRAPKRMKKEDIHRLVLTKQEWIHKKQAQQKSKAELVKNTVNRDYSMDSKMPFLGKQYPILFLLYEGLRLPVIGFDGETFIVKYGTFDTKKIREAFLAWYKNRAKEVFAESITHYQIVMNEPIGQVRIKEQNCCYGSCSAKRNLNFNWKLILAPRAVLDYVVVHEMCHLREMNHSQAFWKEVEQVMPDYKIHRRWLKENGMLLQV